MVLVLHGAAWCWCCMVLVLVLVLHGAGAGTLVACTVANVNIE
jgi:hypothetical protein